MTFTSQQVSEMAGINRRTLMYYVNEGLLSPENANGGQRKTTIWNDKHLREARWLSMLHGKGISIQKMRRALDYLRDVLGDNPMSTGEFLVIGLKTDKLELVKIRTSGEAVALIQQPGQIIFSEMQAIE